MVASIRCAATITAALNHLTFNDADNVRALFGDLVGRELDPGFC